MPDFTREEIEEIVHKLKKANLAGIDLRGANLRRADLGKAYLSRVKYDHKTTWPKGLFYRFDPEAAGPMLME